MLNLLIKNLLAKNFIEDKTYKWYNLNNNIYNYRFLSLLFLMQKDKINKAKKLSFSKSKVIILLNKMIEKIWYYNVEKGKNTHYTFCFK